MPRRVLCLLMSLLLIWMNFAISQQGLAVVAQGSEHEDIHSHIDFLYRGADQLGSLLDRAQIDIGALLESLDFDSKRIIEFVQSDVRYQAYAGVLRGPDGTLVSRSGNALDQSLLLARLLNDAGYEARIVRGQLAREHARTLLRSMPAEADWPSLFGTQDEAHRMLNSFTTDGTFSPDSARRELRHIAEEARPLQSQADAEVAAVIQAVLGALSSIEDEPGSDELETALLMEQQDYFWVEYRLDHAGGWAAAHPAFGDAEPPDVVPGEYFKNQVPEELQHRIKLQAFVETKFGEASSVFPLMAPWERPAANAAYVPQMLTLSPITDFQSEGQLDLEEGLARAEFFALYLNGALAPGANVFSLEGLVGPPETLTGGGAFFGTVSKQGLKAADALSSLGTTTGERESVSGLTRVWFEFSIIAPGGEITTMVRDVLRTNENGDKVINGRVADRDPLQEQLRLALFQNREILVSTGPVSPTFSVAQGLSLIKGTKESIGKLQQLERQGLLSSPLAVLKELKPLPDYRAIEFFALANGSMGIQPDGASYLAQPMIVTFNRGISRKQGGLISFEQTDILFNARRSLEWTDGFIQRSIQLAATQGVWDTRLEASARPTTYDSMPQTSAFDVLVGRTQGLRYISPLQESELGGLNLAPSVLQLAKSELQSGFGLLLPADIPITNPSWWRVDTTTGTVTGMGVGPGGYGGVSATEYAVKLASLAITTVYLTHSIWKCYENYTGVALLCCLFDSIFTGMVIALITYFIAALVVELFATSGKIVIGAAESMSTGLVAKQNSRMIGSIIALLVTGTIRTGIKTLPEFRIKVCGTITGT